MNSASFSRRHTEPWGDSRKTLLDEVSFDGINPLIEAIVPAEIYAPDRLDLPEALSESNALASLKEIFSKSTVLKNAPHTAQMVVSDEWHHLYLREKAAFPVARLRKHKFWPVVGRVDNLHRNRKLVCTCDTLKNYATAQSSS